MKRIAILLPLIIISSAANATETDIHEKCLKAADYAGCVKVSSGRTLSQESSFDKLLTSMKMLPSRLSNTNRRDFYNNVQPFTDALGTLDTSDISSEYETYIYNSAKQVSRLLDEIASTWSDQITLRIEWKSYYEPVCKNARQHVNNFNSIIGSNKVRYIPWTQKVLWQTTNGCNNPTALMVSVLNDHLRDVTEDPVEKKKKIAAIEKERKLCEMKPWNRHLEKNPDLKAWAIANPAPAEIEKKKFLSSPKNNSNCGSQQKLGNVLGGLDFPVFGN